MSCRFPITFVCRYVSRQFILLLLCVFHCFILGVMQWLNLLTLELVLNDAGWKSCLATLIDSTAGCCRSRVTQRKRAGPITQRSMDQNQTMLFLLSLIMKRLDNNICNFYVQYADRYLHRLFFSPKNLNLQWITFICKSFTLNRENLNTTCNNLLTEASSRRIFLHNREYVCRAGDILKEQKKHLHNRKQIYNNRGAFDTTAEIISQQQLRQLHG